VFESRGIFITLEGIDGCGKSTQTGLLMQKLDREKISYIPLREPGGTAAGEAIRQVLLDTKYDLSLQAELLLYMAARSEVTRQVIMPALKAGKIVICDRFTDSTMAYQGYGGGADLGWIRSLNKQATCGTIPDLTILLDLPPEEAVKRRGDEADRMESKDVYFHKRVRAGYLEIASEEPQRIYTLDATAEIESIRAQIWQVVKSFINRAGDYYRYEL
jgi:dTMP kinase